MESESTSGDVINLGNPAEHTALEYAHMIRELGGVALPGSFYWLTRSAMTRNDGSPDIAKARDLVAWEPLVGLQDGLSQTIEYSARKSRCKRRPDEGPRDGRRGISRESSRRCVGRRGRRSHCHRQPLPGTAGEHREPPRLRHCAVHRR